MIEQRAAKLSSSIGVTNSVPFDNNSSPKEHCQPEIDIDKLLLIAKKDLARNLLISIQS